MIGGSKNKGGESKDYSKSIGMFEATPVAVNPTREDLEELLGVQLERDPEYTGIDKNGKEKATVSIWMKEKKTGELLNVKFFLVNQEKESQNKPGNLQYINEVGTCTWSMTPSDMPEWFTKRAFRKALVGEEELHDFLRCWLNLDYGAPDTTLQLDVSKIFKGKVEELRDCVKNFSDTTVCALATVRIVKDAETGENKEYQAVYNRKFLPGGCIRYFPVVKGAKVPRMVTKFVEKATDPEYGCNDHYTLDLLMDYDPGNNPIATDSAIITENKDGKNKIY